MGGTAGRPSVISCPSLRAPARAVHHPEEARLDPGHAGVREVLAAESTRASSDIARDRRPIGLVHDDRRGIVMGQDVPPRMRPSRRLIGVGLGRQVHVSPVAFQRTSAGRTGAVSEHLITPSISAASRPGHCRSCGRDAVDLAVSNGCPLVELWIVPPRAASAFTLLLATMRTQVLLEFACASYRDFDLQKVASCRGPGILPVHIQRLA